MVTFVNEGDILDCDMMILEGNAVVDESLLTGETVPVIKESLPKYLSEFCDIKKYVLYSGTKLQKTSSFFKCLVIRTGFQTQKG